MAVSASDGIAQETAPAGEVQVRAIVWERFELENGLQVLLAPDSTRGEVAVELWIQAGSRHEPVGRYGLAHPFEHAMPYGRRLARDSLLRAVQEAFLTDSNARTRPDYTRFFRQGASPAVGLLLLSAADRLEADPVEELTEGHRERHLENVLAEMARFESQRWGEPIAGRLEAGTFGRGHPYGHAVYGPPVQTRSITPDDLVRWFRAHVRPEYTTLIVVGGFEPEPVRSLIADVFGRIPGGSRPVRSRPEVPAALGGRDSLQIDADSSLLFLRWPIPQWSSPDFAAC